MLEIKTMASHTMQRDIMHDGRQVVMMYASWQQGKRVNISLDLLDADYASQHIDDIHSEFDAYLAEVRTVAAADGIPI